MTAKEYLNKIRILGFQIEQKEKQLEEARSLQGRIQSFDYSREKVQTSPHGDANIERAVKIMTLEQELSDQLILLQKLKSKISDEIAGLGKPEYVELLTLRYCEFYRLEAIAMEMNLSYYRIKHMHGEALKAFDDMVLKKKQNELLDALKDYTKKTKVDTQ